MSAAAGAYLVAVAADAEAAAAEAAVADEEAAAAAIDAEATLHADNPTKKRLIIASTVRGSARATIPHNPYRIPRWFNTVPKLFPRHQTYPEVNPIGSRADSEFTKV